MVKTTSATTTIVYYISCHKYHNDYYHYKYYYNYNKNYYDHNNFQNYIYNYVQMEQRQLQQLEKHQQLLLKWLRALFRCGKGKLQDPR